ncbi:MAG: methyl-accepting chemotaxis protein [Lachnospiraceae bacterium]|nr:methyl-accepting chemotaxis protein [Lachnospiraceae bacterium]
MKHIFSLRNKIVACILVPIIFIVVVGIIAYGKAKTGLSDKYIESTLGTLDMSTEYMEMLTKFLDAEVTSYTIESEITSYVIGLFDSDPLEKRDVFDKYKMSLSTAKSMNPFIANMHIITPAGVNVITSVSSDSVNGMFKEYLEQIKLDDYGRNIKNWVDKHELLDNATGLGSNSKNAYFISYQKISNSKSYIVTVDISEAAMIQLLDDINIGEGGIVGMVTADGKELLMSDSGQTENVFAGTHYYEAARTRLAENEELSNGYQEIKFGGKDMIFMYSVCESSGIMVCGMIPKSFVVGQASSIRNITFMVVALALLVVAVFGSFIIIGIQGNMKNISSMLSEVAKGNLTVSVKAKGKDEFSGLAESANDMIGNTRGLVEKVNSAAGDLSESASALGSASEDLNVCSADIMLTVNNINDGMERQSEYALDCVENTQKLSDNLEDVSRKIEGISVVIKSAEAMITEGMGKIKELGGSAQQTIDATNLVSDSIESLRKESEKINEFVTMITDISSETNLLSLNASIEAARAGEAGRGFAVVAEEIRKLADSSADAAREISNNVDIINEHTNESVNNAVYAGNMVQAQSEIIDDTVKMLEEMQTHLEQLGKEIDVINAAMDNASKQRDQTVTAVESISGIIDETANNAKQVFAATTKLESNVTRLNETAGALNENMQELKDEIAVFTV